MKNTTESPQFLVAIFQIFTLTNLSKGFHEINFKLRSVSFQQDGGINHFEFLVFVTGCDLGVASKLIKTQGCCISDIQCPLVATGNVLFFACLTLGCIPLHPMSTTLSNFVKRVSRH